MTRIRSFWLGLSLPIRAAKLIVRTPRLLMLSLFPLLVTLACYVWAFLEIGRAAHAQLNDLFNRMNWNPDGWGMSLLLVVTYVLSSLFLGISFSFGAGIAAAPVNDFLAEHAERVAQPPLAPVPSPSLGARVRLVALDIVKVFASITLALFVVALQWIPIVNVLLFPIVVWAIAFQYVSYPQTRRSEGLAKSARFFIQHPFATLGFGSALSLAFAIPGVGVLALPCAVVGGTLLYARAADPQAPRLR